MAFRKARRTPENGHRGNSTVSGAMMIRSSYCKEPANTRTVKHISDYLFSYITTHGGQCNPPEADRADLRRVAQDGDVQEMVKVDQKEIRLCCHMLIILHSF